MNYKNQTFIVTEKRRGKHSILSHLGVGNTFKVSRMVDVFPHLKNNISAYNAVAVENCDSLGIELLPSDEYRMLLSHENNRKANPNALIFYKEDSCIPKDIQIEKELIEFSERLLRIHNNESTETCKNVAEDIEYFIRYKL